MKTDYVKGVNNKNSFSFEIRLKSEEKSRIKKCFEIQERVHWIQMWNKIGKDLSK